MVEEEEGGEEEVDTVYDSYCVVIQSFFGYKKRFFTSK